MSDPGYTAVLGRTTVDVHFDITSAPNVPVPYSPTFCVPVAAMVEVVVEPDGTTCVRTVEASGPRAKKDGTPSKNPATATFYRGSSVGTPGLPDWMQHLADRAEAMVRGWTA